MSEESQSNTEKNAPESVAIESKLPLTAIDIESEKDMESGRYHPLRSLHKWFAARPTPAARLSVLASVYPGEIDPDELLQLMQIGPKAIESNISEYVQNKYSSKNTSGTLDDHYNYPNPNTQSPTSTQLNQLHETLKNAWGGELPTVLDPTAGRGVIPFESIRYGIPAHANELNPVPTLILKVALEYAPVVGSLENELKKWRSKIHEVAKENISPYYPTEEPGREILNSACTYIITCDSCGGEIPLVSRWTLNKTSKGGDAIRPTYDDGIVKYEHVKIEKLDDEEFNSKEGPVSGRDAECPHCSVVTEEDDIQEKIRSEDFEYSIYGVNYETSRGDWKFRAGSHVDHEGMAKAKQRVESDFDLMTFLTEPIDVSSRTNDPTTWGMKEWRDIFTPRQLVSHYEYLRAYNTVSEDIRNEYSEERANAILAILTFPVCKAVDHNSRLSVWRDTRGYGANIFGENHFSRKKMFVDNNISAARRGYINNTDHAIESYEKIASYVRNKEPANVTPRDAATLTDELSKKSVDAAIVDPPYYSSIMYGELSDLFYVVQKEYLKDDYPYLFSSKLTNKDDEAVANPYRFKDIAEEQNASKKELADNFYEQKMEDIFSEVFELLTDGGVMTVMFTHRDMDAWDTLTTALIGAGFTITATHPIKTEMSDRVGLRNKASADSSILLVGRKLTHQNPEMKTLWEDIQSEIQEVASKQAEEILDSGYTISKTDTAIAAYGPTLKTYAEHYPVVNKKGDTIRPRKALSEARKAVTGVIANRFLRTQGLEKLDALTRWYILAWLIYENDTFPYDEGLQLGVAAGVDVEDIKRSTKIWSKSGGDICVASHNDRVQNIVMLTSDAADNPSSRKYPVDPTDMRFTYTIDTIHAALHVYDKEGARAAKDWLLERNVKSNTEFEIAVTALMEVIPVDNEMSQSLVNMVSGETGDYLDIDLGHINISKNRQQGLDEF
jgi:adenine-specific DNA methylase